ncbi:hypothetical protein Acr_28g0001480 [Actinidia rufa]|uniref:F-box domain-containing protein n=1 Tax=Actinidia rufa TaxID=165716 RepID=A0A7J0H8L1_9ERIC|nr:hypothetical protein Acr_28g0001480 [Actinidia rufa]
MVDLPTDIISQILSRIPMKSLFRFRCVAKLWCCIIDHPFFAYMHLSQCNEEHNMLLLIPYPTYRQKKLSFRLVEERGRNMKANKNSITEFDLNHCVLLSSCNGLVCIQYENKQSYVLLNPLRTDFLELPKATIKADYPEPVIVTCGFGFDASTSAYKVVRVVCRIENLTSRVIVHRVGTSSWREDLTPTIEVHRVDTSSWRENLTSRVEVHRVGTSSWREIGEVPPHPVEGKPVFAHGFLHWLVNPFRRESEGMIVSFHIGTEKFQWTPHPKVDATYTVLFQLVDMKGNLGMVDLSSKTNIDIWVQKDYKNKEWVRQYRIDIRAPCGRSNIEHIQVIGLWENGEILLKFNDGFFIYSPKTGLRYNNGLGLESDSPTGLHSHRGSLISIPKVTAAC